MACTPNMQHSMAEKIVLASIEAHGGMDTWKQIETMQFRKKTWLYKADNSLERYSDELHTIHQKDSLRGVIRPYDTSDKSYLIQYENGRGKRVTTNKQTDGTNAFLASHFVVNQPFKILDPEAELSYVGKDTLDGRRPVEVVKTQYKKEGADTWWYYFDAESHILLATLIYHAPTYAFVVNEKIEEINGILWNTRRTTYRTDSLRNVQFIRAKFEYSEISSKSTLQ